MRPYKSIKSKNLALMLFLARAFAYMGIILFFVGIIVFVTMTFTSTGFLGSAAGLTFFPFAFILLVISSLLAAVVSLEENYRLRTEYLISKE